MNLKAGVKWSDMHDSMWYARGVINQAHIEVYGLPATCTSARRPQSPGGSSLHPEGKALDVRTWSMGDPKTPEGRAKARAFTGLLATRLGPDFDVVLEGPASLVPVLQKRDAHIHVEYDPKDFG